MKQNFTPRVLYVFALLACSLTLHAQKKSLDPVEDENTHLYGIGYYDKNDKPVFVVPARYPYITSGSSYSGYKGKDEFFVARVSPEGLPYDSLKEYVVFDRDGKQTGSFRSNDYFNDWFPYIGFHIDRKIGLLDHTGAVLLPPVYLTISPEFASCKDVPCPLLYFIVQNNDSLPMWGLLNAQGGIKLPFVYEELFTSSMPGWLVAAKNGRFGWIDPSGKEIIALQFDRARDFNFLSETQKKRYAEVALKNEKGELLWGLIDTMGKMEVPCIYNSAEEARKKITP